MEKKLRNKVASILRTINAENYPSIYDAIQVETGYKNIENEMIQMALNEGISLESTLYHIERQ